MRHLIRLASMLYPKSWRERYATEFAALLDDVNPGWRDFLNVLGGALAMQLKSMSVVPVACAVVGALIGVGISLRAHDQYQSTAMVRLHLGDVPQDGPDEFPAKFIGAAIQSALKDYTQSRDATSVNVIDMSATPILEVAFGDPNGATAQRAMQEVVGLLEQDTAAHPAAAVRFEILNAPTLPRRPNEQSRVSTIALGCGIGLMAGGLFVWGRRLRA